VGCKGGEPWNFIEEESPSEKGGVRCAQMKGGDCDSFSRLMKKVL